MSWHVVKLNIDDTGSWFRIASEFEKTYINSGCPENAALYDNQDTTTGNKLYFSPIASEIAAALISEFGGSPCDKPTERIVPVLSKSDFAAL